MTHPENPNITQYHVTGTPPPWSITGVSGFVTGVLQRIQREGQQLPERFWLSACPWGERNALGGTPEPVQEVTNPRLRLVHFTSCGRPYLVILLFGDTAITRQQIVREHLPWSEHFAVVYNVDTLELEYLGCTEDIITDHDDAVTGSRTLRLLLEQGQLADF